MRRESFEPLIWNGYVLYFYFVIDSAHPRQQRTEEPAESKSDVDIECDASKTDAESLIESDRSNPPNLSDAFIIIEVPSSRTVSNTNEEIETGPEDLRRSQEIIRPCRSDEALRHSLSLGECAGSESHGDVLSGQDLDFDSSLRVLDRTFDEAELALWDPSIEHSTESQQEGILTQEGSTAPASATSVVTTSSSQEREEQERLQDAPSKSSRRSSLIRRLTRSGTRDGHLTRRRKLSPAAESEGAPAPPPKRRHTESGNSLLRSVYKVHDRIRAVSLN